METLFDYLKTTGDLSFEVLPFKEEDYFVLSNLVYIRFSAYVKESESIMLSQAVERVLSDGDKAENWRSRKNDYRFLLSISHCPRYMNLLLTDSVNLFSSAKAVQYYSFTLHGGGKSIICYKGTDLSLAGWKEDFETSYMKRVPSQHFATLYLKRIARKYDEDIILTGHSKGGNLAVFSFLNSSESVKKKVKGVYNFDGPGFLPSSPTALKMKEGEDRIMTYVPSSSMIGMIMEHAEEYSVIASSYFSIFQHDPYSWLFEGRNFCYLEKRDRHSLFFDRTVSAWLEKVTIEERMKFTEILFSLYEKAGYKDFVGYSKKVLTDAPRMAKLYMKLSCEEKKVVSSMVRSLIRTFLELERKKGSK